MGTWGSPSPKPSRCWGTALGAKWKVFSKVLCITCSSLVIPRPWLPSLYRTLTKIQRKKLADRIKKLKITIKRKKQDGSISVSMSQFILEDFTCI